jgi:3-hydroxymyristoyl/3-hydroxydecanoyl-(acyl carrier protein) dehydratase
MNGLFELDRLEGSGNRFGCRARVPEATPLVEGHFPGHAIVPGIGILALVADVLALGLQRPVGLQAIESVRFRAQVEPGSELQVEIEVAAASVRFRVAAATGALVANGSLRLGGTVG